MNTTTVLVTDGHLRSALAVVRSLGRAGFKVHVCSSRRRSLAGSSRFAASHVQVPDPMREPARYLAAVRENIRRYAVSVLIPVAEESLLVLLDAPGLADEVSIPFPSLATFSAASDKASVTAIARALGIDVPEQVVLQSKGSARAEAATTLGYPVVVKPARSVAGGAGERQKFGIVYAESAKALDARLDGLPEVAYPVLVQRRIEGVGTGVFSLLWDGEVLAQFAHRRLREKPPSGGVSVYCESIRVNDAIFAQSHALLRALGWRGCAMVEYKTDNVSGKHYLMEINGRLWGSLQLAVDSQVDFPRVLVQCALGYPVEPVRAYDLGVRSRWWWGEVDHLIARIREPGWSWARQHERFMVLKRFTLPAKGTRNEVLRFEDPMPFVRESIDWLGRK